MTLQQLKYIITVAECGNITEAAEKLFIAQPSLTAAIHSIENEMGITAFIRSNKGVELTRDGEVLLSYAMQLLEQADLMTEHFIGEHSQKPRFSVSCQHYSFAVNAFIISPDRLCLSPQCGFASCEIGNKLSEEEQWAKLALVKEIAEEVWVNNFVLPLNNI